MEAFIISLGLTPSNLFAGFAGGLVAALVTSGSRPSLWSIFSSVIVGGGCGGYLGPLVPGWMPLWMGVKVGPGTSFGVGVASTPLCRGIILAAQRIKWDRKDV